MARVTTDLYLTGSSEMSATWPTVTPPILTGAFGRNGPIVLNLAMML